MYQVLGELLIFNLPLYVNRCVPGLTDDWWIGLQLTCDWLLHKEDCYIRRQDSNELYGWSNQPLALPTGHIKPLV